MSRLTAFPADVGVESVWEMDSSLSWGRFLVTALKPIKFCQWLHRALDYYENASQQDGLLQKGLGRRLKDY
ncbi:hypothetical protein AS19_21950 [Alcanivorax sp. NBRC 101098]|nr:hypothetical protein AS19_21950 [Alcanivorax sp. NBRC 101098]